MIFKFRKNLVLLVIILSFYHCSKTQKIVKKSEFDTSDYHIQIAGKLLNKYSNETNRIKKDYYLQKAESELNRANSFLKNEGKPKNYKLYNNLGLLAYYKKDHKEAIRNFKLSQELNSTNTESFLQLGILHFKTRKTKNWQQKAEDNFYKVLSRDLGNIKANYYLGRLNYEKLDFDKAQKYLNKVIQIEKAKDGLHYTKECKKIINNISKYLYYLIK